MGYTILFKYEDTSYHIVWEDVDPLDRLHQFYIRPILKAVSHLSYPSQNIYPGRSLAVITQSVDGYRGHAYAPTRTTGMYDGIMYTDLVERHFFHPDLRVCKDTCEGYIDTLYSYIKLGLVS